MVSVQLATKHGGKTTPEERRMLVRVRDVYTKLLTQIGIRRNIPVIICDEWTWLVHLGHRKTSLARYGYGGGRVTPEIIYLRAKTLTPENFEHLLKHELIHSKLGRKEKIDNEHGVGFRKLARKHGLNR